MQQNKHEWKANPRRRKPNQVDIFRWLRFLKKQIAKLQSIPGGPYYLSVAVVVLLGAFLTFADISTSAGKIHSGVQVAGFSTGGLSEKEAVSALQKQVESGINKEFVFQYQGRQKELAPAKLQLEINYKQTVSEAFAYGRSSNLVQNVKNRFLAWLKPAEVAPIYTINKSKVQEFLHELGGSKHTPARNSSIEIKGGRPVLIKSKSGFGINQAKAEIAIIKALLTAQKPVLTAEKLVPTITEEQAKNALKESRLLLDGALTLKYGKSNWKISNNKLAELFEAKEAGIILKASLAQKSTIEYINSLAGGLNKEPVSATFAVSGVKVDVIAGSDGLKVDTVATYKNLLEAALRKGAAPAEVVVVTKKPKRTTEQARKMGVKELVSTFTTYYPAGKPRVKNIHRLAEILDGMLVAPGEEFSFNGRIGKRTIERGFVAAPEIRDGEFIETVGGGICQVSTTVFNAVLLGGYPIGERSPHSLFIKKYPSGRDAAVSYPKPDLTFTNDTKSWILIKGGYSSTGITISFYSTDYGRKVSFDTKFLGETPFPTKEEKDATLEEGKKEETQKGVPGKKFHVIRTVTKDGKVIRKTNIHSTFNPTTRKVRVGTKKKEPDSAKATPDKQNKPATQPTEPTQPPQTEAPQTAPQ